MKNKISYGGILSGLLVLLYVELIFMSLYYIILSIIQFFQVFIVDLNLSAVESNKGVFNPLNIIVFCVGASLIASILFLELVSIITITVYSLYNKTAIPLKNLLLFIFQKYKSIFHIRFFPVFLLVLLLPKDHIVGGSIYSFQIPPFIMDGIFENVSYIVVFCIVAACLFFLFYRLIFVLHIILFEPKQEFISICKRSYCLTQKIGFFHLFSFFIIILILSILYLIPIFLLLFGLKKLLLDISVQAGDIGVFLLTIIHYFQSFIIVSMPGVLFLVYLTFVYVKYSNISSYNLREVSPLLICKKYKTDRQERLVKRKIRKKKFILFLGFLTFISGVSIVLSLYFISLQPYQFPKVPIIAHRGYLYDDYGKKQYMENTMGAIENAYKRGADFVEIDVFESKDGSIYLAHDATLKRIAGVSKKVYEMTDEEIDKVILKDGSHIPRLEKVLAFIQKINMGIFIEPKIHGHEKNMYSRLIELIKEYNLYDKVKLHSLSLSAVTKMKSLDKRVEVGYIVYGVIGNLGVMPADFFSLQETIISRSIIENIHSANKQVYVWTVNKKYSLYRYIFLGVDGLITDKIEEINNELLNIIKKQKESPFYTLEVFNFKMLLKGWAY